MADEEKKQPILNLRVHRGDDGEHYEWFTLGVDRLAEQVALMRKAAKSLKNEDERETLLALSDVLVDLADWGLGKIIQEQLFAGLRPASRSR